LKILRIFRRALILPAILLLAGGSAQGATSPTELIGQFHSALLEVMKESKTTGIQQRFKKLEPAIEHSFYLALMIRVASGNHWNEIPEAKRAELTAAFGRMSVGTYASRFDGYSGESFKTVGEMPGPSGTVLVKSQVLRPGKPPVDLTYVTKKFGEEWRIVDVLLDNGISELAVRRSEYHRILANGGVDRLIQALNQKTNNLIKP